MLKLVTSISQIVAKTVKMYKEHKLDVRNTFNNTLIVWNIITSDKMWNVKYHVNKALECGFGYSMSAHVCK